MYAAFGGVKKRQYVEIWASTHEALEPWDVKSIKYYLGISISVTNPNPKEVLFPMDMSGLKCKT